MKTFDIITFIGGLALFLYGMQIGGENLQKSAGRKLRNIISGLTSNRFFGAGVGVITTVLLNSSSAMSVILVSLASAKLITLTQSIGVLLGSSIGTSITVQLIAFKVTKYSLLMIGVGFFISIITDNDKLKILGKVILAFGFIFLGMLLMSQGTKPLKDSESFINFLETMGENPILAVIIAAIFTSIIQSSAGTIGILISLSYQEQFSIPIPAIVGIVIGANIGTCATGLLASFRATVVGKQVAIAHLLFKVLGTLIFLPFISYFGEGVQHLSNSILAEPNTARIIANIHISFNILNTLIFLPLIAPLAWLTSKIMPLSREKEGEFKPLFLQKTTLYTPEIALSQTKLEILRMGIIVIEMAEKCLEPFEKNDFRLVEEIEKLDDKVDTLEDAATKYLTKLGKKDITGDLSERIVMLISVIDDIENIGDLIVKNIMVLARKKIEEGVEFSKEGWEELTGFHRDVLQILKDSVQAFEEDNETKAKENLAKRDGIKEKESSLRRTHISRLTTGFKETLETSSIHLDLLYNIRRINVHALNIDLAIIGEI